MAQLYRQEKPNVYNLLYIYSRWHIYAAAAHMMYIYATLL